MAGDARPWGRSLLLSSVTRPGDLETELGMGSVVAKPCSCQAVEDLQGLHLQWESLPQTMGWKPALDPHPEAGQALLRAAGSASLGCHHPATMPEALCSHPGASAAEAKVSPEAQTLGHRAGGGCRAASKACQVDSDSCEATGSAQGTEMSLL